MSIDVERGGVENGLVLPGVSAVLGIGDRLFGGKSRIAGDGS